MRKSALSAILMLAGTPVYAQTPQSVFAGAQTAGSPTTASNGQTVYIPWIACTDATNARVSCAGSGGGGSTPTGTAGSPNANVVTVQGISNGTPQNVQTQDTYTAPTSYSAAANTVIPITVGGGQGTAAVTITGLTASGATLTASVSDNKGANYYPARYMGTATVPGATTITTDGIYSFATAGHTNIQLQVTTGGTGNFTVASNLSTQVREVNLGGAGTAATNPLYHQNVAGNAVIGKVGIDQTTPGSTNNVTVGGLRYQLFGTYGGAGQAANATGTAVGPVLPNSYIFACSGTIGGGAITLQVLGPDGATFQTVSGINFTSLPASVGVVMPNITGASGSGSVTAANARAVLTGATNPSVFCSLS